MDASSQEHERLGDVIEHVLAVGEGPQLIDKIRDVVRLYLDPPDVAVMLCVDEKSQT